MEIIAGRRGVYALDWALESGADLGVAFDGDADRCVIVDEKGGIIGCDLLTAALPTIPNRRDLWLTAEPLSAGGAQALRDLGAVAADQKLIRRAMAEPGRALDDALAEDELAGRGDRVARRVLAAAALGGRVDQVGVHEMPGDLGHLEGLERRHARGPQFVLEAVGHVALLDDTLIAADV